ncbi:bifunctional diaminohydroxyphosphoribosylaminopyrimidine deaminase/5-amino-6-(5-phosphoribosylamino)uracil reductase RibD [Aliikangiella maris]|uniref:Bifunctional diaminohydroxyphosphoribosylaminopyrimidine deaminase/5-amino-6-(5-phosphoribosylamino)uracil reductase RibD n=2 Tax=Aliikangiella maris TaxID=3162458 RepID=A0ABV3MU07_9GAMM
MQPEHLLIKNTRQWSTQDREWMSLALQLAKKGRYTVRSNPLVGCVIIKDGQILGQGWHEKAGMAHAEINALTAAKANGADVKGAICYVTLEPCSHQGKTGSCATALVAAGIGKVICAMEDPNPLVSGKGFARLLDAGIAVEYGLYEDQAQQLNRGFCSRMLRQLPWLTCKLAMSLDGRTALASGESQWITGAAARQDVHRLRATQDAIITGAGTVTFDNPSLTVRLTELSDLPMQHSTNKLQFKQPARVIIDPQARVSPQAKVFNDDASVYWVNQQQQQHASQQVNTLDYQSDFYSLLQQMALKGMNYLMLESGHQLAGGFLQQGLIDELHIYMAPKLMGNYAKGLFELNIEHMQNTPQLALQDIRQLGEDIRLIYQVNKTG